MKRHILGIAAAAALYGCAGPDIRTQVNQELSSQGIPGMRGDVDRHEQRLSELAARYERLGIRSATNAQGLDLLEQTINSLYLRALEHSTSMTETEERERRSADNQERSFRENSIASVVSYVQTTHALLQTRNDLRELQEEIEQRKDQLAAEYGRRISQSNNEQKRQLLEQYPADERAIEESYTPRIQELEQRVLELQRRFEEMPATIDGAGRRRRRVS